MAMFIGAAYFTARSNTEKYNFTTLSKILVDGCEVWIWQINFS